MGAARPRRVITALGLALSWLPLSCEHGHGHDHAGQGHDHGHADEHAHGARAAPSAFDHASIHPTGHDHHAAGHGHDQPMRRITLWSATHELFAEHPAAVAGQRLDLLVHLTRLSDFSAVRSGRVSVTLEGPEEVSAEAKAPIRAGIYRLSVTLPKAGRYRGSLAIAEQRQDAGAAAAIEGIEIIAHADAQSAKGSVQEAEHAGVIELLKEQQWGARFGTAAAEGGRLADSIEVAAIVETPPDGMAEVGAPVAGRLVAPAGGLARPGQVVKKGQLLATLVPTPASPEAAAQAGLMIAEAEGRVSAAKAAHERATRLFADQAISKRELEDAEREQQVAGEALAAARRASALFSGASSGGGSGSWRVVAPLAGTVVTVKARPGATLSAGELLFRVANTEELWLHGQVPEQDASRVRTDRGGAFRVAGAAQWTPIGLGGEVATAKVVTLGRLVDPISRTVDLIYSLADPPEQLRIGGMVQLSVPTGKERQGVLLPRGAIVDEEGRELVYVQLDGEHFEERAVRSGPRSGGKVIALEGVVEGERVVSVGAHLVRLASGGGGEQAHGHIH